ncbi:MAG: outer membrane beta-barrel protein [Candidatus Gastranaerophilales bacterium]|nr:outer membrane beta-barrel protein [Candidatus Gastranaerophilales bacterium]
MKKGLLAVLLAVAMAVPSFAAKGDMSVNAKLGLGVNNSCSLDLSDLYGYDEFKDQYVKFNTEMPISIDAEFFYGLMDNLSVGLGVNYVFDSNSKGAALFGYEQKVGVTNIYFAVKPEAKIESNIFSSIYLIGQVGLSMGRFEFDYSSFPSFDTKNGLYLGLGMGTTIKDCVIVEVIFSSSNFAIEKEIISPDDIDVQYTATTINVGYKFAL